MESTTQPTVSFSLTVKDAAKALSFYIEALGATELYRMPAPDGSLAHAEFKIGNTRIYISDEAPDWYAYAMPAGTMASCLFAIATDDCDAAYKRAMDAGAISLKAPVEEFWGSRSAIIKDPFGFRWSFNQQIENLSLEEIEQRAQALFASDSDAH